MADKSLKKLGLVVKFILVAMIVPSHSGIFRLKHTCKGRLHPQHQAGHILETLHLDCSPKKWGGVGKQGGKKGRKKGRGGREGGRNRRRDGGRRKGEKREGGSEGKEEGREGIH